MLKITIKRNNEITNGASFETQAELDEWYGYHSESFGEHEAIIEDITAQISQEQTNIEARVFLNSTDYKVLRHIRQQALGIATSLTAEEYLELEHERQAAAESIIH